MIKDMTELTSKLSLLKLKKSIGVDDISEVLDLSYEEVVYISNMLGAINSWIADGGYKSNLVNMSNLCKNKSMFKFMHNVLLHPHLYITHMLLTLRINRLYQNKDQHYYASDK